MAANPLPRLRKLCLALPEAHEVIAWGAPTFRVRNKLFAMFASGSTHHGAGQHAVWCKATHVTQDLLIHAQPERFFSPPYVGPSGWVGVVLDGKTDWGTLADLLRDAWALTAPKRVQALTNQASVKKPAPRTRTSRRTPRRRSAAK